MGPPCGTWTGQGLSGHLPDLNLLRWRGCGGTRKPKGWWCGLREPLRKSQVPGQVSMTTAAQFPPNPTCQDTSRANGRLVLQEKPPRCLSRQSVPCGTTSTFREQSRKDDQPAAPRLRPSVRCGCVSSRAGVSAGGTRGLRVGHCKPLCSRGSV